MGSQLKEDQNAGADEALQRGSIFLRAVRREQSDGVGTPVWPVVDLLLDGPRGQ